MPGKRWNQIQRAMKEEAEATIDAKEIVKSGPRCRKPRRRRKRQSGMPGLR